MRLGLLVCSLLLAGCHAEQDDSGNMMINHGDGRVTVIERAPTMSVGMETDPVASAGDAAAAHQRGRVIDLADALGPAEEEALTRRLAGTQQAGRRTVMVILIEPNGGQSLEQVGWAVGGNNGGSSSAVMILANPKTRQVRVEGDLKPEARAMVAAAMQEGLTAGRIAQAVESGLVRLEQLAP